jgi:hypothetical protein
MSLLKEDPMITLKPDYNLCSNELTMISLRQDMQGESAARREVPQGDGRSQGQLKGFCCVKKAFDRAYTALLWQMTIGTATPSECSQAVP